MYPKCPGFFVEVLLAPVKPVEVSLGGGGEKRADARGDDLEVGKVSYGGHWCCSGSGLCVPKSSAVPLCFSFDMRRGWCGWMRFVLVMVVLSFVCPPSGWLVLAVVRAVAAVLVPVLAAVGSGGVLAVSSGGGSCGSGVPGGPGGWFWWCPLGVGEEVKP